MRNESQLNPTIMSIEKYLDISTAHVPPNFDEVRNMPLITKYDYGWFLYVPDKGTEHTVWPVYLIRIIEYARKNNVSIIRLDADAVEIDALETFNW